MKLNTFAVHREELKGKAMMQITFDEDYNLPDYKPDFSALISRQGNVRIEEIKVTKGHVFVKGLLKFEILYRAESVEHGICSLESAFPFQETLAVDEAEEFDTALADCQLEDLSIHMTNSRKLGIRALLDMTVKVSAFVTEEFPEEITECDTMEVKNSRKEFLCLKGEGRDQSRVHEEIELPANKANIQEILWKQIQLQGVSAVPENGHIQMKGELALFCLYSAQPGDRLEWYENRLPISCSLEADSARPEDVCYVWPDVREWNLQYQEDLEGENRVLVIDGAMRADYRLYEEMQKNMLQDLYALDRKLMPKIRPVKIEHLVLKNASRCKVNDMLNLEQGQKEILQLCSCFGQVQIDHTQMEENAILVEGAVQAQILYLTKEDNVPVDAAEGMLPFQYRIDVPGMTRQCRYELCEGMELMSVVMKNSSTLEVQALVNFDVIVFSAEELERIEQVEEMPLNMDELLEMPGMTGIRTKEGDTLWDIAKENHTTVEEIMRTNQISEGPLPQGTAVLLMKQVR